ncbi:MAG: BatA and WFA domain-containing protein [Verrucomicrobiota bacterium]|jgi:hypothetical protein|nr:BatA and WFA domain-containing protein [Verrucomicrobiota bacterium]MDP7049060.1 BatA and WFA domain-containing protein [Verrucomicrobiota bacterium]
MNFLTPESLAFAATLPVVVIFYLLKRRRVARLVSSTILWQRFLNETQASSPFQKLRHNWLLIIQLILLVLAVFALTRPYFAGKLEGGRFIVAILDVSASMQATDVSPSRLGQAKAALAKLIDSMYDNDRMVLLLAGAVTEVRQSPTSSKPALRSALGQVRATDSPTRLLDAIKLAQNLTRNRVKAEVHLFSDGASPDLDDFELQDLDLAYHRVGEGGDNLGIVSLEVRPHPEQPGQQAVFATVANASTNPLVSDVSLFFGERLVGNRRVSVSATNTASLVFVASYGTNGVFRLLLKNNDALAVDNTATALSLARRDTQALLVTKGNQFLERALRSVPKLNLAVAPNLADPAPPVDFVVLDGVAPTTWPSGNVLAIHTQSTNWFRPSGPIDGPLIVDWKSSHPLLRYVNFDNVQVAKSLAAKLPAWFAPLVESPSAPLVAAGENDGQRAVWIGFNPLDSTWPLRVSFPIFVANAAAWLNPAARTGILVGEPFHVRLGNTETPVTIQLPDGSTRETKTTASGELVFGETGQQGVYTASFGTNTLRFCVNLLDRDESRIRSRESLQMGEYGTVEASVAVSADKEAWRWFAMLCLVFVLFEWWFYHRRTA